jgi:hypothetical protein
MAVQSTKKRPAARRTGTSKTTTKRATARKPAARRAAMTGRKPAPRSAKSIARTRTTNGASRSGGSSATQMTTNRNLIRRWVEARGGYPATVSGTGGRSQAGVLRIDYPGYSGRGTLERISWDDFFRKFNEADLVFLYQQETKGGGPSRFSKFVSRREAEAQAAKRTRR